MDILHSKELRKRERERKGHSGRWKHFNVNEDSKCVKSNFALINHREIVFKVLVCVVKRLELYFCVAKREEVS